MRRRLGQIRCISGRVGNGRYARTLKAMEAVLGRMPSAILRMCPGWATGGARRVVHDGGEDIRFMVGPLRLSADEQGGPADRGAVLS